MRSGAVIGTPYRQPSIDTSSSAPIPAGPSSASTAESRGSPFFGGRGSRGDLTFGSRRSSSLGIEVSFATDGSFVGSTAASRVSSASRQSPRSARDESSSRSTSLSTSVPSKHSRCWSSRGLGEPGPRARDLRRLGSLSTKKQQSRPALQSRKRRTPAACDHSQRFWPSRSMVFESSLPARSLARTTK